MSKYTLTVLRHVLRNSELINKIDPEWFYEKKDWVYKIIVTNLKENPKLFDKSLLIDRLKHSNYNIDFSSLSEIFEVPSESFEPSLELLKSKYTRFIISEQISILGEMIKVEEPSKIVNKLLQIAHSLPKFEKETKGILDDLSQENKNLLTIHTSRRPALERLLPMYGSVIVIAGDSGHHKTNSGIDVLCNALDANISDENFRVCFFSKEMEWKQIRDRILSKKLLIPFEKIVKREVNIKELKKEFQDRFPHYISRFKIIPSESINSFSDVAEVLMQQKPNVWVFDYIQLMADEKIIDVNSVVRSAAILFKTYSKIFNNLCIELAQLRKKGEQRKLQVPTVDDIEYAGSIKHQAECIGLCWWAYKHNNHFDPKVYVTLWKKTRNSGEFNEFLEVNPEYCDMRYSLNFYDNNKKLKSEFIKYLEI